MRLSFLASLFLLIAACLGACGDNFIPVVQVSPHGDDANDGFSKPVRTLRRGIEIATANTQIRGIDVDAGRYDKTSGEGFPYYVPADVTISGPVNGGAVLAGVGTEPGLLVNDGELRDLTLEGFSAAVISGGVTRLLNLHVRASGAAIYGAAASRLTAIKLDVVGVANTAGMADVCSRGVVLTDDASFTGSEISVRAVDAAFQMEDMTTASISRAHITGVTDGNACSKALFHVRTPGTFTLDESVVENALSGIIFELADPSTPATIKGTLIRNMRNSGLIGRTVTLTMSNSEIASNGQHGLEANGGTWNLDGVTLKRNIRSGAHLQGNTVSPAKLMMRGCTILNNYRDGVNLYDVIDADLGTVASPGNNTFLGNTEQGLLIRGCQSISPAHAVGNAWRPNVQGANSVGENSAVVNVTGSVTQRAGNNYAILPIGCVLQR